MRALSWRLDEQARRRNLIFVHVPRAAGTSIAHALYGPRNTLHHSIRYFRALDPGFHARAESFAVLRDPVERFASSFAFVRAGGTPSCRMSDVFIRQTRSLRTVDDYLSYLEGRDPWSLDFVMRPQSWFVCDLKTGAPLVKRLFLYGRDDAVLSDFLKSHGVDRLAWLNPSMRNPLELSARQRRRIEKIYARDFELVGALRYRRAQGAPDLLRAAGVAAE